MAENNDSPQSKTIRQRSITAWAIKAPEGNLSWLGFSLPPSLSKSEYNRGYRCVRVQITEVQE